MHWAYGKGGVTGLMLGRLVTCGELTENSSTFTASPQVNVSTETPTLEEYKDSASVQSLLITPETGWTGAAMDSQWTIVEVEELMLTVC